MSDKPKVGIGRWIISAAGALALALVTVPLMSDRWGTEVPVAGTELESAHAEEEEAAPGSCNAKQQAARLDFTLKDMDGKDVRLADYKGKVILLNFWATWCGPCKYEIPAFVDLQAKYRDKGLAIIGISTDDPPSKLKPFAAQYKMNYPVLVGDGRDDVLDDAYGPMWGIPVTYYIKRDGTICKKHMGVVTKEMIERDIQSLL